MVVCYNGPARNKKTGDRNNITVFLMETNRYVVWSYEMDNVLSPSRMGKAELLETWEPIEEGEE